MESKRAVRASSVGKVCGIFALSILLDSFSIFESVLFDNLTSIIGLGLVVLFLLGNRLEDFVGVWDVKAVIWFSGIFGSVAVYQNGIAVFDLANFNFRALLTYLQVLVMFAIVAHTAGGRREMEFVVRCIIFGAFSVSLISVVQHGAQGALGGSSGRFGVEGINLNMQSFLYALVIMGLLFWWLTTAVTTVGASLGFFTLFGLLSYAFAMAGSRSGFAMLAVGFVMVLFSTRSCGFVSARWYLANVLCGVTVLGMLLGGTVGARLRSTFESEDYGHRPELADLGLRMALERPILGWGAGYMEELGARFGWEKISAHNMYLQYLIAFGLLGFGFFSVIFLKVGSDLWRQRRHPAAHLGIIILVSMLVFGVTSNLGYNKLFWFIVGLLRGLPKVIENADVAESTFHDGIEDELNATSTEIANP